MTRGQDFRPGSSFLHRNLEQGFYSLMFLAQAMAEENLPRPIHMTVATTGAVQVKTEPLADPEKATVLGPVRVIPRELPGVSVSTLDVVLPPLPRRGKPALQPLAEQVLEDLLAGPSAAVAALRGEKRYELGLKPAALPERDA